MGAVISPHSVYSGDVFSKNCSAFFFNNTGTHTHTQEAVITQTRVCLLTTDSVAKRFKNT